MSIPTREEIQAYTDKINAQFSVHEMWNGYHIRMFKRKNLVIGGSQDWTCFHNIDVIFKKVIFFNLPQSWSDTQILGDDLFRLATLGEFHDCHPEFDTQGLHIFALDFGLGRDKSEKNTRFVVARTVFLEKYVEGGGDGKISYKDPLGNTGFHSKENRLDKM